MFEYAKPETKQKEKSKDAIQKKEQEFTQPNLTGIPDATKTHFENLSGFSFDDVRVHYNSDKPAQLQALAYTQGNQVYVGPGQEKHLGHELGHVVQQKQGIVSQTKNISGITINDDPVLEGKANNISKSIIGVGVKDVDYTAVIQCNGRGNHLYNDFLAHFTKHWLPVLRNICINYKTNPNILDKIVEMLKRSEAQLSFMREYSIDGRELFDSETLTRHKGGGENEKRYGAIITYIDTLMNYLNCKSISEMSVTAYQELVAAVGNLREYIEFYMVDSTIGIVTRDKEILYIFRRLLDVTLEVLNMFEKAIKHFSYEVDKTKDHMIKASSEKVWTKNKVKIDDVIDESKKSAASTGIAFSTTPLPRRSAHTAMFTARRELSQGLRDLEQLQLSTENIIITGHCGTFRMNPDEIPGDNNDCFFLTLIALGVVTDSIETMRNIIGCKAGEPIKNRGITSLAQRYGLTINIISFDFAFRIIQTQKIGDGGTEIFIGQIWGFHFVPIRRN